MGGVLRSSHQDTCSKLDAINAVVAPRRCVRRVVKSLTRAADEAFLRSTSSFQQAAGSSSSHGTASSSLQSQVAVGSLKLRAVMTL